MKRTILKSCFTAMLALLCSCSTPDVKQYAKLTPTLDLEKYFVGTTHAWGMFQKRDGTLVKRFHVTIIGTRQDGKLILDERFQYDVGTTQQRIWTLTRDKANIWHGHAGDVSEDAIGETAGNALHWQYGLLVPADDSTWNMHFDDWMFLIDDHSMINRASMSKWGIEFGQVTLYFTKND